MNRTLKTFLLLLLIATLPLQGAAAVLRLSCGPTHHLPAQAMSTAHHHGAMHADAERAWFGQPADATAIDQAPAAPDTHEHSSCSACAACCVGAAAPPPTAVFAPVYGHSRLVVTSPPMLMTGFIPATLERPPRVVSA